MKRLETRGPAVGVCNICGVNAKLTDDHIPPKGVPRVGQVYLDRLSVALGAKEASRQARMFQRGVKYRSICADCNNVLLGSHYDPTLVAFCQNVQSAVTDLAYAPTSIRVQQNRLFRSVIGHLLAHGLNTHRTGTLVARKTDYFLDTTQAFPSELRLYCWVYPYRPQVVARGLGTVFDFATQRDPVICSILKFFPLAWMCSIGDLPGNETHDVIRVDHLSTGALDDTTEIVIAPSILPPSRWPEAPRVNGAVLHNDLGTIGYPTQSP